MTKRLKIGDVVEISLPDGNKTYAQYTHKHKMYGALIRVYEKGTRLEGSKFSDNAKVQFSTFFPLSAAIKQEIVSVVENLPIKEEHLEFPVFKAGVQDANGDVHTWWLWDGDKEWKVGKLSNEQKNYPFRGVINDTLLIERICGGWKG